MEKFRYKEIMLLHSDYPNSKNLTVGGQVLSHCVEYQCGSLPCHLHR